jgi:hypothetical protein
MQELINYLKEEIKKADEMLLSEKYSEDKQEYDYFLGKWAAYEDILKRIQNNAFRTTTNIS